MRRDRRIPFLSDRRARVERHGVNSHDRGRRGRRSGSACGSRCQPRVSRRAAPDLRVYLLGIHQGHAIHNAGLSPREQILLYNEPLVQERKALAVTPGHRPGPGRHFDESRSTAEMIHVAYCRRSPRRRPRGGRRKASLRPDRRNAEPVGRCRAAERIRRDRWLAQAPGVLHEAI